MESKMEKLAEEMFLNSWRFPKKGEWTVQKHKFVGMAFRAFRAAIEHLDRAIKESREFTSMDSEADAWHNQALFILTRTEKLLFDKWIESETDLIKQLNEGKELKGRVYELERRCQEVEAGNVQPDTPSTEAVHDSGEPRR